MHVGGLILVLAIGLGAALPHGPAAAPVPRGSLPAPALDDEPNDHCDQASWIDLPLVDGAGCIDPAGDVDVYQFSLEAAGSLVVHVRQRAVPGHGSVPLLGGGFQLTLLDETQVRLAAGVDSLEVPLLGRGTYFLRLTHLQQTCYLLGAYAGARRPQRQP